MAKESLTSVEVGISEYRGKVVKLKVTLKGAGVGP
jgi:hypothetical protein